MMFHKCFVVRQFLGILKNGAVSMLLYILLTGCCVISAREKLPKPEFDSSVNRNVTAQLGNPAFLDCVVKNLQDRMVSWIRARDFHVLTVGRYRYTTDERFEVIHNEQTHSWRLKIIYTNLTDIGQYECQVSSDPKVSFFVTLNVVVPMSKIHDGPDYYMQSGNDLKLVCEINQSFESPKYVFWYHNDRMIAYDQKAKIHNEDVGNRIYKSMLFIEKSQFSDSGNYTCSPSNANPATITVHILNGETHAAIHDNGGSASGCWRILTWTSAFPTVFLLSVWTLLQNVSVKL
ncbi:Uncharacterised protein g7151 [Pycnogonum litorale]